jgi:Reverse transcriptase (RNA-dependent DNA polymerase)
MDVTFFENEFYFEHSSVLSQGEMENDQNSNLSFLTINENYENQTQPNLVETEPTMPSDQYTGPFESTRLNMEEQQMDEPSPDVNEADLDQLDSTGSARQPSLVSQPAEGIVIQSTPEPIIPEKHPQVRTTHSSFKLPVRTTRGKPPKRYVPEDGSSTEAKYPISNYTSTVSLIAPLQNFANQLSSIKIPGKLDEALSEKNWVDAMESEMNALKKNGTWEIVDLPEGKETVGCKWVYTIKYNEKGEIDRYKARLVAKGYTQTYEIDYEETFSPVAKLDTIRVILSLAANFDWPLHQFDVKNAFLHGDLKEDIYMDMPPGYRSQESKSKVCKLKKALYGLKQSPRAWFGKFCMAMKSYDYQQGDSDHTMFFKRSKGKITILIIYVDDMIITGNDKVEIERLEGKLNQEFEMKNLGGLKYFLGIEVSRNKTGITLSQRQYILDLLAETGMLECTPAETPMVQSVKLSNKQDQIPTNKERYQKLVGKLIYLSHTRPDITYAVGIVSQYMHDPKEEHMDAVVRIIRYLKGTPGKGVTFGKNGHTNVEGYTDADWAGDVDDRKSRSGYFTFLGGNLVTWKSKKQNTVALSSAEAEFRGIRNGVQELMWLKKLLEEIGYDLTEEMKLFCDNQASIQISQNPVQHDRTKHIEVDRHFIKEKIDAKLISLPFVRSHEQVADILTKVVASREFNKALEKLKMKDIYVPQ